MVTARNATASSKQGQSSAGAGCTNTRNKMAGMMVKGAVAKGSEIVSMYKVTLPCSRPKLTTPTRSDCVRLDVVL